MHRPYFGIRARGEDTVEVAGDLALRKLARAGPARPDLWASHSADVGDALVDLLAFKGKDGRG